MKYMCTRKPCARELSKTLSLNVSDVGLMVVQPGEDPADVVEEFAVQAGAAGLSLPLDDLSKFHAHFCEQRPCRRRLQPYVMRVDGLGEVVVGVGEDPTDTVLAFGAKHDLT